VEKNIGPTIRFLEFLQGYDDIHMIFLSSGGTLYGNPEFIPVNESYPLNPLSFHGAGKVSIEFFLKTFSSFPGKYTTILRPSNIYGPGQRLRSGFGVVPTMLGHILNGTIMEIWGDGTSIRDYLYIEDMITAIICLIDLPQDNNIYNIVIS